MSSILAIGLLLSVIPGGTQPSEELNAQVARKLWKATQEHDHSAYPIVREVLLDMAEQRYEYLSDVRLNTFDYIEATGDTRVIPLLKEIANLPSPQGDSLHDILDAYAIRGALSALLNLESDDVAELSRRHVLSHPLVQLTAIRNLKQLAVWEATSELERVFCTTPPIGDHHVELGQAAEFLEASPETSSAICPCLAEVGAAFKEKIGAPLEGAGTIFYEQLGVSLKNLTSRLGCPSPDEKSGQFLGEA